MHKNMVFQDINYMLFIFKHEDEASGVSIIVIKFLYLFGPIVKFTFKDIKTKSRIY